MSSTSSFSASSLGGSLKTTSSTPSVSESSSTATALSSIPSYSDNGPSSNVHPPSNSNLLNYYFLLLAIFIIVFVLVYYVLARRRKQKIAHLRSRGQNALAQDLVGWPGTRRWVVGSWSGRYRENGREEGLNEQGEAPPPYMPKEPDGAVVRAESSGGGIMLRDLGGNDRKPPDYREGSDMYR